MVIDRYILKETGVSTLFVTVILSGVILLTQSLRFLELVMESGASAMSFLLLTLMALPRFFEVIVPFALMAAVLFVYHRMAKESELMILPATGLSPLRVARPALLLSFTVALILLLFSLWISPATHAGMQHFRQVIKAQYSDLLFREGVFNAIRPGLTVFIREKEESGLLRGLMIHDQQKENEPPVTILAESGELMMNDTGYQVVVYNGTRQQAGREGTLNRLDFQRYVLEIPEGGRDVRQRWAEPDERTIGELLRPDIENNRDIENLREFRIEIHKRFLSPLLAPSMAAICLVFLLLGPYRREGPRRRLFAAVVSCFVMLGIYLASYNEARQSNLAWILMYVTILVPLFVSLFMIRLGTATPFRKKMQRHAS